MNSYFFAFLIVAGFASMITRWLARSPSTSGRIRDNYTDTHMPLAMRNGVAVSPLYGVAALLLATTFLAPATVTWWLWLGALLIVEVGIIASNRVPAPFLPTWMKREIADGSLPLARPNGWDRLVLWLLLTACTVAEAILVAKLLGVF